MNITLTRTIDTDIKQVKNTGRTYIEEVFLCWMADFLGGCTPTSPIFEYLA